MGKGKRKKHRGLIALAICALAVGAVLLDSRFRIVTTEYELSYVNLPSAFDDMRIVQVSDLHMAEFGREQEWLLRAVEKAEPDIIAATGDFIGTVGEYESLRELFVKLCAIAPTYFVGGNHEWASGEQAAFRKMLEELGVTYLDNSYVELVKGGESIILAGVEDPNGRYDMLQPDEVLELIRTSYPEHYVMLLAHRNYWAYKYPELPADTILCGHAHGGLVRLPFVGGLVGTNLDLFPEYTSGVYSTECYDMVVSRGLGNSVSIPRFLNNPHLPVIILKTAPG